MFFSWAWPDGTATFVRRKWGGWKKGVQHFLPWCLRAPAVPSTHFPDLPGLPASSSDTPHFKEFSPAACIKGVHQSNRKFFTTSQIVPPGYMIPTRTGVPFPIALLSSISSENLKLDDGWPESVEEQGLLLLVWRHHIRNNILKMCYRQSRRGVLRQNSRSARQ